MRRARFFFPRASISSGDDEAGFCGRTDDFEDINICCGKVEDGDFDDWIRPSKKKDKKRTEKEEKNKKNGDDP